MEKEDKYFLIDICGTLYQSNTTFDFIRYFFSEKPWYIRLNGLRKNKLFRFCNTKAFEYLEFDCLRSLLIRHLKGYSKKHLTGLKKIHWRFFIMNIW